MTSDGPSERYRVRVPPQHENDAYRYFGPWRTRQTAERIAEKWAHCGDVRVEVVHR